jgi:hypothetical protein
VRGSPEGTPVVELVGARGKAQRIMKSVVLNTRAPSAARASLHGQRCGSTEKLGRRAESLDQEQ